MSDVKHTPGPWVECKDGDCTCGYIFGDQGRVYVAQAMGEQNVDQLGCPDPHPTQECAQANARLIAAAPDMLEALARICALDPTLPIGEPPDPHFFIRQAQRIAAKAITEAMERADAAIAKATAPNPGTASVAHGTETGTRTESKP